MKTRRVFVMALAGACSSRGGGFGLPDDAATDSPTATIDAPESDSGTPSVDTGPSPMDTGPSPRLNRWYFHSEYETQLSTLSEHVGYCSATWSSAAP
jgi:hypothetical protein